MLTAKRKQKLWTKEIMAAAVKSINDGMGIREASRVYNIPFETLWQQTTNTVQLECHSEPPTTTNAFLCFVKRTVA